MSNLDFEAARTNMIEQQIRPWDVLDQNVLDVMASVPRENFVPEGKHSLAFMDTELPLGHGEFMMPPRLEGRILQALRLRQSDVVLEVGTGSGYLTACLASLASHVYTVEIHQDLADLARERVTALGKTNVTWQQGDAAYGWREAPGFYDAIAVTASLPEYDSCYEQQLKPGGRLFFVVGEAPVMEAILVTRIGENSYSRETLFELEIKPLIGREKKPEFVL